MGHKHRTLKKNIPLDVQLPITPMLDMSFQLLAFFVMTFQSANALEGQLEMYLPKGGAPAAKSPDQVDLTQNSDAEIEKEADISVVVTSRTGNIESIAIREKASNTPVTDVRALRAELTKIRKGLGSDRSNIKIEADSKLKYGMLVDVMDACLAAGFKAVGFAPPPDIK